MKYKHLFRRHVLEIAINIGGGGLKKSWGSGAGLTRWDIHK